MTDFWYISVVFDGRYLLVPQNEVESVEIIADVQIQPEGGAVGWFFEHGFESKVFCLSHDFSLLSSIPEKREYLILLKNKQPVGITCDEVEHINIQQEHLYLQDLPVVMKTPQSPISQLLIYQEKIGCVCRSAALIKYLNYLTTDK